MFRAILFFLAPAMLASCVCNTHPLDIMDCKFKHLCPGFSSNYSLKVSQCEVSLERTVVISENSAFPDNLTQVAFPSLITHHHL